MSYVKCINNEGYEVSLRKGKIYRRSFQEPALSPTMIRVIDETYGESGSEIGYLYAADRFEPVEPPCDNRPPDDSLTIHLPADLKGILYAEAIVAQKSMSALVRQWIEERLDLPEPAVQ
jgi:hypothetical protein